ncbi:MAG: ABC transporter ATP-binding protein [Lachnospiraceae bacterium]|nr:ABC transporter ATP-binding protein [Lachnospiraceae bacterium]
MKKGWYWYVSGFTAMGILIWLGVLGPQLIQQIIDDVLLGGNLNVLNRLLVFLVLVGVGKGASGYLKEVSFDLAGCKVGKGLRKALFHHLQKMDVGFFERNNVGELMARINDDIERIWGITGFIGMLIIEAVIHTICVIVCMAQINPLLTLIPLCTLPLVGYTAIRLEKEIDKSYDKISETNAELTSVAQQNISGVRTVRAFAREAYEMRKFRQLNEQYCAENINRSRVTAKWEPNISFYSRTMLVLVIVVGGICVMYEKITLGELGAFTEYANSIIWPMECLGWLSNEVASSIASNRKIQKLFEEQEAVVDDPEAVPLQVTEGQVTFEHVDFAPDGQQVLEDISFTVKPGQTLGIMGLTGSGKTTIVNLLERFYETDHGRILVDGQDIRQVTVHSLRQSVAVVMQDVFLFSDSIRENLRMGSRRKHQSERQLQEALQAACAADFVEKLPDGVDTVIGERGVGLSGGQKQRISMARAFAHQCPILVLDDATSALDMETAGTVQQNFHQMNQVTKIIIAHRISSVSRADEIIILDQGRIVERGTHAELLEKRGQYYQTWVAQYGE